MTKLSTTRVGSTLVIHDDSESAKQAIQSGSFSRSTSNPMLPKITYTKVLKMLEHYRKQHLEDRMENPSTIPPSWGSCIRDGIRTLCKEDRIRYSDELVESTVEYLIKKGHLVRYAGDVTFPTEELLPTEFEIRRRVEKLLGER